MEDTDGNLLEPAVDGASDAKLTVAGTTRRPNSSGVWPRILKGFGLGFGKLG